MKVTAATLYTRRMVPLGQMLELLHRAFRYSVRYAGRQRFVMSESRQTADEVFQNFKGPLLDTLHLINCATQAELANGGLPSKVVFALDDCLSQLFAPLDDLLAYWTANVMCDNNLQESLKKAMDTRMGRSATSAQQHAFIQQLAYSRAATQPLVEKVWELLDYTPAIRNSWLAVRIAAGKDAPLMRKGKVGYWVTLVENMSWDPTYARLGVDLRTPRDTSSSQGQARLPELLATLPGYTVEVDNHQDLKSPKAVRIPEDVLVAVDRGWLILTRQVPTPVDTGKVTDVAAWGAFCKKQLIAPPTKKDRQVSVACSADNLLKGLETLQRLTALKVNSDMTLQAAFEQNLRDAKRDAAVDKLKKTFSTDEMAQLADYFAAQK